MSIENEKAYPKKYATTATSLNLLLYEL